MAALMTALAMEEVWLLAGATRATQMVMALELRLDFAAKTCVEKSVKRFVMLLLMALGFVSQLSVSASAFTIMVKKVLDYEK
jgi:hypothetical protein